MFTSSLGGKYIESSYSNGLIFLKKKIAKMLNSFFSVILLSDLMKFWLLTSYLSLSALKTQIERVQRRVTRWILKQRVGVMSYRDRLLTLKLLPLTFDRELKDLVFFLQMSEWFY